MLTENAFDAIFAQLKSVIDKYGQTDEDKSQIQVEFRTSAVKSIKEDKSKRTSSSSKVKKTQIRKTASSRPKKCKNTIPKPQNRDVDKIRKLWSDKEYLALLDGSYRGLSRTALSKLVDRSPAKIFSKIQKHMNMIALVETALFKIKKSAANTSKNISHISMTTSQIDFDALCKYISLSIGLKTICKAEDREGDISPSKDIAPFIPLFILQTSESDSTLIMRLATLGLTLTEIDNILEAISLENKVHIRRVGKTRLFCKAMLQRRVSEDQELRVAAEKRSKRLP